MKGVAQRALVIAKGIQQDAPRIGRPPEEGTLAQSEQVIPFAIVRNSRGYIEKVVNQINGSYEHGWYDCCAVMIRRLVETLIIETFESHGIAHKIKNSNGDFLYLKDLIDRLLNEQAWNLGRNARRSLPKLKDVGDQSAHSRRFIAYRSDIENVISDLRVVVQELIFLARLK